MNHKLQPFQGFFSPGLHFASGHSLRIYRFASTPNGVDPFIQIWLLRPDKRSVLYIDSPKAKELVQCWYRFDQVVLGEFSWDWRDSRELNLEMMGEDGAALELRLKLGASLATSMLNATIKLTPAAVMRSSPMVALSERLFNSMLGLGGVKIDGRTDQGFKYYTEADQILMVKSGTGILNGDNLGEMTIPDEPIYLGKTRIADRPIMAFGTAHIELPQG